MQAISRPKHIFVARIGGLVALSLRQFIQGLIPAPRQMPRHLPNLQSDDTQPDHEIP